MKKYISIIFCSILLLAVVGCNQLPEEQSQDKEAIEISALETYQTITENPSVIVIDVRTPEEYHQRHLSNSTLIPLDSLQEEIDRLTELDKTDEIIVYCRSGNRSAQAQALLDSMGYTNVKSMAGGINAWTQLGYNVCLGTTLTC
ncbi:rhodanese-like domain-containing protein [Candidatus Peregrinibacteria bacterium]|nr:rhodanese-like domain-containing protein [Candidatus Peregrinibacteria bacterium]